MTSNDIRLERARIALEGLSVGDAFGERFFVHPDVVGRLIMERALPAPPWPYTDDTEMALSLVAVLRRHGAVDQDALAQSFAERADFGRGYGAGALRLLRRVKGGQDWRTAAADLFGGQGSYGNGAAMRVAPLGAFFADDLDRVVAEARRSAEVTHAHPEGVAGAIAVAVAAAWAWRLGHGGAPSAFSLCDMVLPYVPESEVRSRIERAAGLSPGIPAHWAVGTLGNGVNISAQDTVGYCLWCASSYLTDYEAALWHTASGLGDVDTNCAIVGGIVGARVGLAGIPADWSPPAPGRAGRPWLPQALPRPPRVLLVRIAVPPVRYERGAGIAEIDGQTAILDGDLRRLLAVSVRADIQRPWRAPGQELCRPASARGRGVPASPRPSRSPFRCAGGSFAQMAAIVA